MNSLIFTEANAQALIAKQQGQHRLGPVKLTDGRWFLMEDVLSESIFAQMLSSIEYNIVPFEEIESLIITLELDLE